MNDHELDTLVARAALVTDAEIAEWTVAAPFDELCEAIVSTAPVDDSTAGDESTAVPIHRHDHRRHPRWRRAAALVTAAAAIIGVGLVINLRSSSEQSSAWAAPLVKFAKRSPLMLMNDSAWPVTRADEYDDNEGEMTFTANGRSADLHWRRGSLREWVDDRLHEGIDHGTHDVVDGTARVVQYTGSASYTALWEANGRVLEFRTEASDVDEFRSLLDTLVVVDVDAWLSAMPDSVVKQTDQPAVIAEMLTGIPLPAGFDVTGLVRDDDVKDRYQLGARVVSAVSCRWIEQWLDAKATGDTGAAQAAVDAMTTASRWPIIQEMNRSGAYGQVLQTFVDAMIADNPKIGPRGPTVAEGVGSALGCGR